MPIQINSPSWRIKRGGVARGVSRGEPVVLPGLQPQFLTEASRVAEEVVLEPAPPARGSEAVGGGLDLSYDVGPNETAILAIRHASGALTFHLPVHTTSRALRGPSQVRFQVAIVQAATRGIFGEAIKAIVVKIAKVAADNAVSLLLPVVAEALETAVWNKLGLKEGWLKISKETLAMGSPEMSQPVSPARSLLLLHGTFSNTASAYRELAKTDFFDRVKDVYGDRVFAFDHFTVSKTPEQNARMLLQGLPEQATTFDVITHSRGGLVLRHLVERSAGFGDLSRRFTLGRAVLVAAPNDGTPLATPKRWNETVGWLANLLEMFPVDNPWTTGAAFVANGLVWIANHASGDLPGLHAMDGEGELIAAIQSPPGPPANAYSALVANYQPTGGALARLLDIGIDQFFGSANDLVVPAEGGWRIDRSSGTFIPSSRIGCFGPGGNLAVDSVTHLNFFSRTETADFLVNALLDRPQPLKVVDPHKSLPDRRVLRGAMTGAATSRAEEVPESAAMSGQPEVAAEPLNISVINGDLTFEHEALLLGHYQAMRLTGTEGVMDALIGGAMKLSLGMGLYPVAIGSHQIFLNARPNLDRGSFMPRPKAVIVVGLGEEGKLRATDLVQTVRQAVIAWAQRLGESGKRVPPTYDLASTLLGSGGTGVRAGDAARLIAQGVYEANTLLQSTHKDLRWPSVGRLRFIELYLDRATEAWQALRMLSGEPRESDRKTARPRRYSVDDAVKRGTGPLQRPVDSGYRGAAFDFITVEAKPGKDGTPSISYTLDTRRARSEVRGQRAQSALISQLVATASNDRNRDAQIGRSLFNLLIPIEIETYLAGSGEMQIELDPQTAAIPWELLDTVNPSDAKRAAEDEGEKEPWAIRVKLLRKLRLKEFREHVTDAGADASVLIIGEPACPPPFPRLYGARSEALAVCSRLTAAGAVRKDSVTAIISNDPAEDGPNARTVIGALFERPWRIVHISGHGQPGEMGKPGGVVLSTGAFLGPDEISQMRTVPELVFINCCYLGSADADELLKTKYDRADFASGVAGALIALGVRCVVAAGWAVDDDVASVFADEFYASLLRRNRFIVAVGDARSAAYLRNKDVNTWAAYQCYGDPDWVFRSDVSDPNQAPTVRVDDFSGVASAASLKLELERIIVQTKFQGYDVFDQLRSLKRLESAFGPKWGKSGGVAELFGEAFVETADVENGMRWYEIAVNAEDGRASMRAAEQLANVRGRLGWEIVDRAIRNLDEMRRREKTSGASSATRAAARRARVDAERARRTAVSRAEDLTKDALALLTKLIAVKPTMERLSLIGSAHKRRALVNGAAGKPGQVAADLRQMELRYREAQTLGERTGDADLYYPAANRLAAEVALNAGTRGWKSLDRDTVKIVRKGIEAKTASDPDFWSVVGDTELRQYEALARRGLASAHRQLDKAYEDLHRRVKATRMWASVYDTACLVLPNYASRVSGKERTAALEILAQLRTFAHPEER